MRAGTAVSPKPRAQPKRWHLGGLDRVGHLFSPNRPPPAHPDAEAFSHRASASLPDRCSSRALCFLVAPQDSRLVHLSPSDGMASCWLARDLIFIVALSSARLCRTHTML